MRRAYLIVPLVLTVLAVIALLLLGAFPPQPTPQPVQRVIPNDQFQPR